MIVASYDKLFGKRRCFPVGICISIRLPLTSKHKENDSEGSFRVHSLMFSIHRKVSVEKVTSGSGRGGTSLRLLSLLLINTIYQNHKSTVNLQNI